MDSTSDATAALREFLSDGAFEARGAVITDLDGTAVLERDGRIWLPPEIEAGLARIRDLGRPVIANTLRFPMSVIRVFGEEWHRATGTALPLVTLKGAQIGRVVRDAAGRAVFEEWQAWPLQPAEIIEIVAGIEGMVADGVDDLLVFSYARDWRQGERIWTPVEGRAAAVRARYLSASGVRAGSVARLRDELLSQEQCMLFLLVATPEDRLMAYQHTLRSSFFTAQGVSKRSGAEAIAAHLGIDLAASIGSGDAPPDDFLAATGFSIIVDGHAVEYQGLRHTVRVAGIAALGELLATIGDGIE